MLRDVAIHLPVTVFHCAVGEGGPTFEGDVDMARRVEGLMMLYGAIVQVSVEVWRAS